MRSVGRKIEQATSVLRRVAPRCCETFLWHVRNTSRCAHSQQWRCKPACSRAPAGVDRDACRVDEVRQARLAGCLPLCVAPAPRRSSVRCWRSLFSASCAGRGRICDHLKWHLRDGSSRAWSLDLRKTSRARRRAFVPDQRRAQPTLRRSRDASRVVRLGVQCGPSRRGACRGEAYGGSGTAVIVGAERMLVAIQAAAR